MRRHLLGLSALAALGSLLPSASTAQTVQAAQTQDAPKVFVSVFHLAPQDRKKCPETVARFLSANGVPPESAQVTEVQRHVCLEKIERMVLVTRDADGPTPIVPRPLTIDVLGGTTQGNVKAANAGATIHYANTFFRHGIDVKLRGEYRLDSGSRYNTFELAGNYEYLLDGHWSVFGFVSVGRDTKQQIAFTSSELGGLSYDFFSRQGRRKLQLSVGAGHRNLEPLKELAEGVEPNAPTNASIFANKGIMSYRLKYEEHLLNESVSLIAALWFQHMLYAEDKQEGTRLFDASDYRIFGELTVNVLIAKLGKQAQLKATLTGRYERFANAVSESNYDLVVNGGLGVQF